MVKGNRKMKFRVKKVREESNSISVDYEYYPQFRYDYIPFVWMNFTKKDNWGDNVPVQSAQEHVALKYLENRAEPRTTFIRFESELEKAKGTIKAMKKNNGLAILNKNNPNTHIKEYAMGLLKWIKT